jgi:uncharacterized membrane protein YphA (DoxX/SURF4 family)
MKQTYRSGLLLFTLLYATQIIGHGFGFHTFVHLADGTVEEIGMLPPTCLATLAYYGGQAAFFMD